MGRGWISSLLHKLRLRDCGVGSLTTRMGTLSVEKQEKLEADAVKAEKKAEKKAEAETKKKEVSYWAFLPQV